MGQDVSQLSPDHSASQTCIYLLQKQCMFLQYRATCFDLEGQSGTKYKSNKASSLKQICILHNIVMISKLNN